MKAKELKEIQDRWSEKYPTVDVWVITNEVTPKFYGKMSAANSTMDLKADTIGDLISQGERFLRQLK